MCDVGVIAVYYGCNVENSHYLMFEWCPLGMMTYGLHTYFFRRWTTAFYYMFLMLFYFHACNSTNCHIQQVWGWFKAETEIFCFHYIFNKWKRTCSFVSVDFSSDNAAFAQNNCLNLSNQMRKYQGDVYWLKWFTWCIS